MSDDFKVDIDKAVRDALAEEKRIEIEASLQRMEDEKLQRDNRLAARDAELISNSQMHDIAEEQRKENDLLQTQREINERLRFRGLTREPGGHYTDACGNIYDSRGNRLD
jgi:hypothetical protein